MTTDPRPDDLAARAGARLAPSLRRRLAILARAPASTAYVGVFTASTVLQRTMHERWVQGITARASTNLQLLRERPVRVLLASALWLDEGGTGYPLYAGVFVLPVAWAEAHVGTRRLVAVALATHVSASLLGALVQGTAITAGAAPDRLRAQRDVGASYVMVGGCVAAVHLLRGRRRRLARAALAVAVLVPDALQYRRWNPGHVLALGCASVAARVVLGPAARAEPGAQLPAGAVTTTSTQ